MNNKPLGSIVVYLAIIVISVFATLQYKNYETENLLKDDCYLDNHIAKTLIPSHFTENIKAMIQQNAPTDVLSGYISCYEKTSDGNYSLKSPK